MIVQCPECNARYRTKDLPEDKTVAKVKCPKCTHQFTISSEESKRSVAQSLSTILMVDDARFFRELMADLLKERKINLLTADSARDAWTLLQEHSIDLLIVDINLPDKNGLDLIQEIRAEQKFSSVPILCISGVYRKDDDTKKAIRAGADDFISKSFKPDELNERIDKLLKL